jgi:DNA methylase
MSAPLAYKKEFAFNAICPYYTMFPLEYPMQIIRKHRQSSTVVLDPFCGRGTTIYAARRLRVPCYGFDTSPIAAAVARAKLASASVHEVITLAETLIAKNPKAVPETAFFRRAYAKPTLIELCSLREGLLKNNGMSGASTILRAAILGCLHGPLIKSEGTPSYFSNQMPRTFASKPDYSVRFWKERQLSPPSVSAIDVIQKKLSRITDLNSEPVGSVRNVKSSDARKAATYRNIPKVSLTITSPPYYGMRTYVQDQWLRMWFLGGDERIDYETTNQLCHTGHDSFVADLAKVWSNVHQHSKRNAHLYVRFGALPSAKSDPKKILRDSLDEASGWKLISVRNAHTSEAGKRQAHQMGGNSAPAEEYDFHAVRI